MGTDKEFLGQKTGPKNFSWKLEKIGIVGGIILGWKIGMKNSTWKVGEKKWNTQ